jgi:CheY-like chemotaxis protein
MGTARSTGIKRILVGDATAGGREILRILLEHEGYEVFEAADGPEAVAMARAMLPDLVLLDLQTIDSYAAVREMRLDEALKGRSILAVTDETSHADRERIARGGFSGWIAKPVVQRTLREQLGALQARACKPTV